MHPRLVALMIVFTGCTAPKESTVAVLAAALDLEEGAALEPTMAVEVRIAKSLATDNCVRAAQLPKLVGRASRASLKKGDLLLASVFAESDLRLSTIIQRKGRALTFSVSGADAVRANDHVDLISIVKSPEAAEWQALTLMQNVVVLSAGKPDTAQARDNQGFPLRRVTFLLLPEEGEIALLGAQTGAMHVSLRNPEDIDVHEERGRTTMNTLFSGERAADLQVLRTRLVAGSTGPRAPQPAPGEPPRIVLPEPTPSPRGNAMPAPTLPSRRAE